MSSTSKDIVNSYPSENGLWRGFLGVKWLCLGLVLPYSLRNITSQTWSITHSWSKLVIHRVLPSFNELLKFVAVTKSDDVDMLSSIYMFDFPRQFFWVSAMFVIVPPSDVRANSISVILNGVPGKIIPLRLWVVTLVDAYMPRHGLNTNTNTDLSG